MADSQQITQTAAPKKCCVLFVSRWHEIEMGVALFDGEDHWHSLMSTGTERLSDYWLLFPTPEGAKAAAYLGVQMYLSICKNIHMPPPEGLLWEHQEHPDKWIAEFYAKPIWPS